MKIQQHTKDGIIEKELSSQEVIDYAADGHLEAIKELSKKDVAAATTTDEKVNIILKYLGME